MITIEEVVKSFHDNQVMDYKEWLAKIIEENSGAGGNTEILNFLRVWKPKIGILCGSFNMFHSGHMNILLKAEKIFDKVILCVGINPEKRVDFPTDGIPKTLHKTRQVLTYTSTLPALIEGFGYDVTLIRGLRNSTDLKYELKQLRYMQDFKSDISVINICCDREFEHIASSDIRNNISAFGTYHRSPYENKDNCDAFRKKIAEKYLPFPLSEYSL